MTIAPLSQDDILAFELHSLLEAHADDIRRIASSSNAVDDMFAQFAELMPQALRETARQLAPVLTRIFREDYFRLDNTGISRGAARLAFPEDQSWIPAGFPRWEETGLYRVQLPNSGRGVLCQAYVASFQVVVFTIMLIVTYIARAATSGPGSAFFITIALMLGILAIGIAAFFRMFCDPSPVMIEWQRGQDPKLLHNSTGGWAS